MTSELEAIVAADEESRARLSFAGQRRERDVASARARHEQSAEELRRDGCDALETEIAAIREASDREIETLRRSHERYLAALAEAGERRLAHAAELYAQIVGGLA